MVGGAPIPAGTAPPAGIIIVIEMILDVVIDLYRSIVAEVIYVVFIVIEVRLINIKAVSYVLVVAEVVDAAPIFVSIGLKFGSLPWLSLPHLSQYCWRLAAAWFCRGEPCSPYPPWLSPCSFPRS